MGDVYNELAGQLRAETRRFLADVRTELEQRTRDDAPVYSGTLRANIFVEPFNERFDSFVSRVYVDHDRAPQGIYTNEGTGVYVGRGRIYPGRPPHALVFYWAKVGQVVAFASVAGQPGQHWWDGPSGGREEERLDEAIGASLGSFVA